MSRTLRTILVTLYRNYQQITLLLYVVCMLMNHYILFPVGECHHSDAEVPVFVAATDKISS